MLPRSLEKTIFLPVLDHDGRESVAGSVVSWVALEPLAFATQMSERNPVLRSNAILAPLADQTGCSSSWSRLVMRVSAVPSLPIV